MLGSFRKWLFGIRPRETTFARRGFRGGSPAVQRRLEQIGQTFALGYHAALVHGGNQLLLDELNSVPNEWRGFAFEGAAMGLGLMDFLTPWNRRRVATFLQGPGNDHAYMVHVGAGWLLARLPISPERLQRSLDPLLAWLTFDGYGFHEGFFHWPDYISGSSSSVPVRLRGYERRVFDQGLGRSLWFVDGADVSRLSQTIAGFPLSRQGDLWSGIGLAATYAGGAEDADLAALRQSADSFQPQLAQGAAFAAKARLRAHNPTPATAVACRILCALPVEAAAQITDEALENLPVSGPEPSYEVWRRRIQARFGACELKS